MSARQLLGIGLVWLVVGLVGAFGIAWAIVEWWGESENPKDVAQCDRASEALYRAVIEDEPRNVVEVLNEHVKNAC